jgi:Tol biopolymer transport system component
MVGTSKEALGTVIASEEKGGGRMNVSPSISPDGRFIAYISERNILSTDIYIADATTGKTLKTINTGSFSAHVDSYSFIESAGTWSPDGSKLAIVIQSKGRNKIMVINTANENKKVYDFGPTPESFTNPSWSPDGRTIAVSGLSDGVSDIYLLDLASEKINNITKDIYSDMQPTYSPDGKHIYFVTDRNPKYTRLEKANFNISSIDLATKKVENYLFMPDADNVNPQLDPSGQNLYFLSDYDGFRNLFKYNFASAYIERLTNFSTGISGITPFSPAMTVASKTGEIAYTHYFKGAYNIYAAKAASFAAAPYTETYKNNTVAYMPPGQSSRGRDIVQENLDLPNLSVRVPDSQLKSLAYKSKFKMDYLGSTGMGVGVTNTGRTGVAGGVQTVFSDILGNNQIMGAASLNGEIQDFGGQFLFLNQKKPLQWGLSAMHVPYSLTGQAYSIDTIPISGAGNVPVQKLSTQTLRQFFSTVEGFGFLPLNTYQRFETGGGFNFVNYSLINYDQYYDQFDQFLGEDRQKEALPAEFKGLNYQQLYLAFVGDNSQFGMTSPLKGYRYRFEARQMFGATTKLTNYTADFRKYAFMKPLTFATRLMYNARQGRDAGTGQLNPLFLGYMGYVRGFYREDRRQNVDHQLAGSQLAMANVELRMPFTGPKRLAAIPSNYVLTDLALFFDVGSAWDGKNVVRQTSNNIFQGIYSDNGISKKSFDPVMSTGISLRVNALGYLILEPYYVLPIYRGMASDTDKNPVRRLHTGYFGVNLVPGW